MTSQLDILTLVLTERPLLTKMEILRALDPTGRAGESAFRRLKRDGFITAGIEVKPRRGGRLSGTVTAFCALNRDAATAYRKQRPDLALKLAAKSAQLESSKAARRLAELAAREAPVGLDAEQLDLQTLYVRVLDRDRRPADELARSLANARKAMQKPLSAIGVQTIVGTVVRLAGDSAEIASADDERYTLPAAALPAQDLDVGSPVNVRVETLGDGAVWTVVEPAWSDEPVGQRREDPFGDLRPTLPPNLEELLDRAPPARPLALIGPRLAWR
jgi:hypothetical protein